MPDRRAVWWILTVIAIGFVHAISITVNEHSFMTRATQYALYSGVGVLGIALGYLSAREGFNVLKPSRTRESDPMGFWVDVAIFIAGFPALATWMLWQSIVDAS
jgi:hypothetical protein